MANINNLDAEIGANLIGDDAQPAVAFSNSSTGPGLRAFGTVLTSTATVDFADIAAVRLSSTVTISSGATATRPVSIARTVYASPTVALMSFGISGASAPVVELLGHAFTSAVSLIFAASGNWAGMGAIRVKYPDGTTYGWIPVLPDGQVTAAVLS